MSTYFVVISAHLADTRGQGVRIGANVDAVGKVLAFITLAGTLEIIFMKGLNVGNLLYYLGHVDLFHELQSLTHTKALLAKLTRQGSRGPPGVDEQ